MEYFDSKTRLSYREVAGDKHDDGRTDNNQNTKQRQVQEIQTLGSN